MTIFDDLTFDVKAFAEMPKCKGRWTKGEAGCLMTAFLRGFGFHFVPGGKEEWVRQGGTNLKHVAMINEFNKLSEELGLESHFTHPEYESAAGKIVFNFDNGSEVEALHMIWSIIERLPNKTGFAKIEDVELCQV